MREADRDRVLALLECAFGDRSIFERYMDYDACFRPADFLLAVEDERALSCVQVFEKTIQLRGQPLQLGGIGSVATWPDARGRGLATELMRRQTDAMRARGMALGLLFAGPVAFYEKLGWSQIPLRHVALRRGADVRPAAGRAFRSDDLPELQRLYSSYSAEISGTTVRDDAYWRGQLRYAGTPDESIRIAETAGRPIAYVRSTLLDGIAMAIEYACDAGATDRLAALIAGACPEDAALMLRLARGDTLLAALADVGLESKPVIDRSTMWCALDPAALARRAGVDASIDTADLLERLVGSGNAHYWMSDRF